MKTYKTYLGEFEWIIFSSSGLGKLVGTLCAVSGVLVLSLPIPIIAGNFETFHKNMEKKNKAEKAKKQLEKNKAAEEKERISFHFKSYDGQENSSYKSVKITQSKPESQCPLRLQIQTVKLSAVISLVMNKVFSSSF